VPLLGISMGGYLAPAFEKRCAEPPDPSLFLDDRASLGVTDGS
jgi:hypothetical protein